MSDESTTEGVDQLLEDAADALESLESTFQGVEDVTELDDGVLESALDDVEAIARLATETQELVETVDFGSLPEAVDGDELLSAIDAGEIPEALASEDEDLGDAVDFGRLLRAIDLLSAWDPTDLGSLWEETRELEEAVEDVGDGEFLGDDGELLGDEDGLVDEGRELLEDADLSETLGDIDVMEDPEAYQVAIQQGAIEGIDAFREALIETHVKFHRLYEFNREKMRRKDTSTNSRNPTAAATIPTERGDLGSGVRHSTVPRSVKLSTAPSRERLYGPRFRREREKRRNDD
ncbi:hypothetical protein [Natrarchaeobius oligotrophus]|uniref:Uncharacterized protein n=1 Tax=Natrarchaeobius chitinivorans TaxID=1679083 RepID=A0A3N6M4J6_NATCH|nr:hypothetical protein [Natrarchaeobius chitinivorans]RQG98453.1 hypothetical protein EA472_17705 [Natrarchaeobius chitinivorans]